MEKRFFEIKNLIKSGHLEEAETQIQKILEVNPEDFYGLLLEAEYLLKKGGIERAEQICNKLIRQAKSENLVLSLKGRILLAKNTQKDAEQAIEIFNYLFSQYPNKVAFLYWLLEAYFKAKKAKEAWELLQSVPYKLQDTTPIRWLKAKILEGLKRYKDAITVYEILQKENPKDPGIKKRILMLKRHLKGKEKWDKEMELIGRLPSSQRDVTLLLTQAQLAKDKGKWQEAISIYNKVLKIDPHNREASLNLGFVLVKTDDTRQIDMGIERLRQFFLENPYNHPVRAALFAAYKRRNRLADLITTLKDALLKHPEKVKIYGWIKKYQKLLSEEDDEK